MLLTWLRHGVALGAAVLLATAACSSEENAPDDGVGGEPSDGGTGGGDGGTGGVDNCDADRDGYRNLSCGGEDCNDANANINPGANEICDGRADENCNGETDGAAECECRVGDVQPCYDLGPDHPTRNVGSCADGVRICGADAKWGACQGSLLPRTEPAECNGADEDCDGNADDGTTGVNACGACGGVAQEVCGNGLNEDCDDTIDDSDECSVSCRGVDATDPGALECCFKDPAVAGFTGRPVPFSSLCVDFPGLPSCVDRLCEDLDGNPATVCTKRQVNGRWQCGVLVQDTITPTAGCGFRTPCAQMDCDDRQNQPCYSGPPQTAGKGICRGGVTSCEAADDGSRGWGACVGEVLPSNEICGNDLDDDCDGQVDEEGSDGKRCPADNPCGPEATELCGDQFTGDDDCDGLANEGCTAPPGVTEQACYPGPLGTANVGVCRAGTQAVINGFWGICVNAVVPSPETCGDGVDSDCDGLGGPQQQEDAGCCVASGAEVCNEVDDDCDGLVDEGVLSACGTCGEPCDVVEVVDPWRCEESAGRICSRIRQDENDPNGFTLDTDKRVGSGSNAIYLAVTNKGQVARLDSVTGAKVWQAPTFGGDPSRTAVPLDNSVWVANRGFSNPNSHTQSNVVHLDDQGNLICKAEITGIARGLAIDAFGDVWAGSFSEQRVFKISGTGVGAPDPVDGLPRCEMFDISPNEPNTVGLTVGQMVYGVAMDERGILWTATVPGIRLDTLTMTFEQVQHQGSYGVAVDQNFDVWYGGGIIHRVNGNGPYVNMNTYQTLSTGTGYAVTVDKDGFIWASDIGSRKITKVDPVTMTHTDYTIPAGRNETHGIGPDDFGKIWAPFWGSDGRVGRFDPDLLTWDVFDVDPGNQLYTYSDFTGALLRGFTARQGSWTQVVDSGYSTTDWKRVDWTQVLPPGAVVEVYARFSASRSGLDTTQVVCGPFTSPAADLDGVCGASIDNSRFMALEFVLRSAPQTGAKPIVSDIEISYTRP